MAKRNYLIEGGSGTGKSAVWEELRKRGYKAINGDRELAYQGSPQTGKRLQGSRSDLKAVKQMIGVEMIRKKNS
jgi:predicted ATPase